MNMVIDASALLALLFGEKGASKVETQLGGSCMSAVNFTEVMTKIIDRGLDATEARALLDEVPLQVIAFDQEQAEVAASFRPIARAHQLSLADCACLSLGKTQSVPILTADRKWSEISDALGVTVKLIR